MTQIPSGQRGLREGARCREVIRAQFGGYERCHRSTRHEPLPHHVRSRSWSGSWSAGTARIRFGVGCDDGCVFGDEVSLWGGSGEALTAARRNRRHPR
jgi:hypothetical protein